MSTAPEVNPTLEELLQATSRTFAIGIELLPAGLLEQVRIAYLLLRISDYIEDTEALEPSRKIQLLKLWERTLVGEAGIDDLARALGSVEDAIPDAQAARRVRQIYQGLLELEAAPRDAVVRHVGGSTLGMARWVERGPRFEVEADLDDYMHEVAGRVGYLLTNLFSLASRRIAQRREELLPLSREFGLALQTVNVIRGLHGDRRRGWVFVPRSYCRAAGVPRDELFRTEHLGEALTVLERLAAKAEGHFDAAEEYIRLLPRRQRRIRLFCLLPFFFGVRTLAISRTNPAVFREETKIGRPAVRRISRHTAILGHSNAWIGSYRRRLARP